MYRDNCLFTHLTPCRSFGDVVCATDNSRSLEPAMANLSPSLDTGLRRDARSSRASPSLALLAFSRPWKRTLRNAPRFRLRALLASTSLLLCMVPVSALAQQQSAGLEVSGGSLP